jgi:hypothetical protein
LLKKPLLSGVAFFSSKQNTTLHMKLGLNSISTWFSLLMITLTVAGAFAFAFTDFMDERLFGTKRVFFVILLVLYSIYRVFRLYQMTKAKEHEM